VLEPTNAAAINSVVNSSGFAQTLQATLEQAIEQALRQAFTSVLARLSGSGTELPPVTTPPGNPADNETPPVDLPTGNTDLAAIEAQRRQLMAEVQQVQENLQSLQTERQNVQGELTEMQTERQAIQAELARLQQETQQHQTSAEEVRTLLEQLRSEVQQLQEERQQIQTELEEIRAERGTLQGEIAQLQEEIRQLESKRDELVTLRENPPTPFQSPSTVTLPAVSGPRNTIVNLAAVLRTQAREPLAGRQLNFSVTHRGQVIWRGVGTTNGNGRAEVRYRIPGNPNVDNIQLVVDFAGDADASASHAEHRIGIGPGKSPLTLLRK